MAIDRPATRYDAIANTLVSRIREGRYDASGLPGERALAQEFGAARVTIRSALRSLEDAGLVVRSERRGTFTASGRVGQRPRLLRAHVDGFLDRGRPDRRKVLAFGFVAATHLVALHLRVREGEKVLRVLRLRSDPRGPLTYTEAHVPRAVAHALTRADLERKAFVQLLEDHGVRFGLAEQAVTAEAADAQVAQALGLAVGSPVLKLQRVLHDHAGKPLQLLQGWYRADRFELRMQISRAEDATRVWVEPRRGQ